MSKPLFTKDLPELFKEVWAEKTGEAVWDINCGWCYQFALILGRLVGRKTKYISNNQHCWIEVDGVFYDSEHPNGTTDATKMDWNGPWEKPLTAKQVREYWGYYGRSGPIRESVIRKVVAAYRKNQKQNRKVA